MRPANDYRAGNAARYHAHWLLRDGDRIVGPLSLDLLERGIRAGKVPLDAEMALDGHDEWLPVARVLPRVKPEVLALPAPADTAPETPNAMDDASTGGVTSEPAPAGEQSHIRARNTCVFWPAPAPARDDAPRVDTSPPSEASGAEPAPSEPVPSERISAHEGEIVDGELVLDDDEWKRATVPKRPSPLPTSWRHRTVLCAPTDEEIAEAAAAAERAAQAQDVEAQGPITERMGAPETDRMPHVGEPDAEEARSAQMRAWQATTQQRPIVRPTPAQVAPQSTAESRAQQWADQPWGETSAQPAPDQPWHQQPWKRQGQG